MKKVVYLLLAIAVVGISVVVWKQTRPPALSPEQKQKLDSFLNRCLSDKELTEEDIRPIVAIGDAAVPHLIKAIGKVRPSKPLISMHNDVSFWDMAFLRNDANRHLKNRKRLWNKAIIPSTIFR